MKIAENIDFLTVLKVFRRKTTVSIVRDAYRRPN
jgi:hypothetical protein